MYNIYKRGLPTGLPQAGFPGSLSLRGRDAPGRGLSLPLAVECELQPGRGVESQPPQDWGRGRAGAASGYPHQLHPQKNPLAPGIGCWGLFPVEGMKEGDKSLQGIEPKCLQGTQGTKGGKARGPRETGPQGADCGPVPRWGDGCRPGSQLYAPLQAV